MVTEPLVAGFGLGNGGNAAQHKGQGGLNNATAEIATSSHASNACSAILLIWLANSGARTSNSERGIAILDGSCRNQPPAEPHKRNDQGELQRHGCVVGCLNSWKIEPERQRHRCAKNGGNADNGNAALAKPRASVSARRRGEMPWLSQSVALRFAPSVNRRVAPPFFECPLSLYRPGTPCPRESCRTAKKTQVNQTRNEGSPNRRNYHDGDARGAHRTDWGRAASPH